MKKRISIVILVLLLCFSTLGAIPAAAAAEYQATANSNIVEFSELEWYIQSKNKTDGQLLSEGYSTEEIQVFRNFSPEEVYLERSHYDVHILHGMGYTDEQIQIIKAYDGSEITYNSPILKASAVCTGKIEFVSYSASLGFRFRYRFNWSTVPVFQHRDYVAVNWVAYDSNGYEISTSCTAKITEIDYYITETTTYLAADWPSATVMNYNFNGYKAGYDVSVLRTASNGDSVWTWAKAGNMLLTIEPDGSKAISTVKAFGAVGHQTLGGSTSVGFSTGAGGSSISFSFTPTSTYSTDGPANYTLKSNGSCIQN